MPGTFFHFWACPPRQAGKRPIRLASVADLTQVGWASVGFASRLADLSQKSCRFTAIDCIYPGTGICECEYVPQLLRSVVTYAYIRTTEQAHKRRETATRDKLALLGSYFLLLVLLVQQYTVGADTFASYRNNTAGSWSQTTLTAWYYYCTSYSYSNRRWLTLVPGAEVCL